MEWKTLLLVIGVVIFFFMMMRGCSGMTGGCGARTGSRRPREDGDGEARRRKS